MVKAAPRYLTIAGALLDEIKAAKYPLGARLPSESSLMRQHNCSRNTVRAALGRLSDMGLITTRRGSGSYVTRQAGIIHSLSSLRSISMVIQDLGFEPGMTQVSLRHDPNPRPDIQAFLGGGSIWRLRRVTTASGTPFSVNDSWFRASVAQKLDTRDLIKDGSLYSQFAKRVGRPVEEAVDYIGAEIAGPVDASLLGIAEGQPLLAIMRYAHDADHQPLEVARSAARADMYRYYVKLRMPHLPESSR